MAVETNSAVARVVGRGVSARGAGGRRVCEGAEGAFAELAELACQLTGAAFGRITHVAEDQVRVIGRAGEEPGAALLALAQCQRVARTAETLVLEAGTCAASVEAAQAVMSVGFYAGAPLRDGQGRSVGALAVMDAHPRALSGAQRAALEALARQASLVFQLDAAQELERARSERALEHQRRLGHALEVAGELQFVLANSMEHTLGELQELLTGLEDPAQCDAHERRHHLRMMQQRITHAMRLLERKQRVKERITSAWLLEVVPVVWGELFGTLRGAFQATLAARRLTLELPEHPPTLIADHDLLERMLMHLIDNAAVASPPGEVIRVRVVEDAACVRVGVLDHGDAVPPELHRVMFTPGARVAAHAVGHPARWGTGLLFCRAAMDAHGGAVRVEGSPCGRGNLFELSFPRGSELA